MLCLGAKKKGFTALLCLLWSITSLVCAHTADTMYRDFWHPRYHGKRLAYCNQDQSLCGDAIATEYCQRMGYEKMVQ